jgi:hypothetical protein
MYVKCHACNGRGFYNRECTRTCGDCGGTGWLTMTSRTKEPMFAVQEDAYGNKEKIDVTIYSIRVICTYPGCLRVRYVKPQDRCQSILCKPHARKARLESRAKHARDKRKEKHQSE